MSFLSMAWVTSVCNLSHREVRSFSIALRIDNVPVGSLLEPERSWRSNGDASAAAVTGIQNGMGIDPFAADAAANMAMAITTLQANLIRIGPFALPAGLASLASLASSAQTIRMALGINPLMPGAVVGIKAALAVPPLAAIQFTTPPAQLGSYLTALNAAAAMGVNLAAPGGMVKLQAKMSALAALSLPPLSLAGLLPPLAAITAVGSIQAAFSVNLAAPDVLQQLTNAIAALVPLATITVPGTVGVPSSLSSQMALAGPMVGASLAAMASMKVNAALPMPRLAPIAMVASMVAMASGLGIPMTSTSPCSASCPMAVTI